VRGGANVRKGFVLMDVLAALALLSAGVFVSLVFFRTEIREVRAIHERFAALLIAESELERLGTLSYEDIPEGAGQRIALALPSAGRLKECAGTLSAREVGPGLKQATVRITWSSPRGGPLFVEMTRVFSREGLGR